MVKEPTRKDKTLDLFLINRPALINRCTTIPGLSDHEIVCVDSPVQANLPKPSRRTINLWKKANDAALKEECLAFQDHFLKNYDVSTPVNQLWQSIKNNLTSLMEKHVPTKQATTRHNQPWITTDLKRLT